MATENLQIPDIQANQNQKEVTANAAHNLVDRAMNNVVQKVITGATSFTTTETRENFVIELTGTPGAPLNLDMPDTNKRTMGIVNNTDDVMTIRNSASGGAGQPVIAVGEASIFHYDGVDFLDFTALGISINIVEDTTPQLGGQLDVNGNAIGNGTEELINFVEISSAINEITVTNAAAASDPSIIASGDDTDINLVLGGKGTGGVILNAGSQGLNLDGLAWPVADGIAGQSLTTDGAGAISFASNYLGAFTVAGLPTASSYTDALALATDASGGRTLVISDGSAWKVFATEGATVAV